MDTKSKNVRKKSFVFSNLLVGKVWENKEKGLKKTCLEVNFVSIDKPTELAKCIVKFSSIQNLDSRKSNYLKEENEISIKIGHAITPIDCYIEEFLKQMCTNELSRCEIMTKSGKSITFDVLLKTIEYDDNDQIYYSNLSPAELFELAKHYKECGVKMFKEYSLFAHIYFNSAAKCLLSCNDLQADELNDKLKSTDVKKKDFDELLHIIYSNIAACLIKEGRYDEIIGILKFVKHDENPNDKAAFRLATAYIHIKEYEEAEAIIKRVKDYKSNKDLMVLLEKVHKLSKFDKEKSSDMAKKMLFG